MLSNVSEIDQETYMRMLRYSVRTGGNVMVFGPAGVGKTECAMQAALAEGFQYVYLNLSVLEAPDMVGLPQVKDDKTCYAPPETIPLYDEKRKPIVLLVDEVDKAKPELQNPCLELFQMRAMNGRRMNIHSVIATGNLPDEGAFSQPVSHALTNRCMVFRVSSSFEPWLDWAVGNGVNPLVTGFLSKNPEFLLMPDASGDATAYCHPSPRAWTMAARDLDGTSSKDTVDFQTLLVSGRVGTAAAVKFRVWLQHYREIEPLITELVQRGTHPNIAGMTIDRQFVCAISACGAIAAECRKAETQKVTPELQAKVNKITENVFGWFNKLPSEFVIGAAKTVLTMKMIQDLNLVKIAPFMQAYLKIRSAMKD